MTDVEKALLLYESNLFKDIDNMQYNLKKLAPGTDNNILYITGYPGAGKTTTINIMKKKFKNKAEIASLDYISYAIANFNDNWYNDERREESGELIKKFMDTLDPAEISNLRINKGWSSGCINDYIQKFLDWVREEAKNPKYKKKIIIIEGAQLYKLDPEQFKDRPMIIMGTSMMTSLRRKSKRDVEASWDSIKHALTSLNMNLYPEAYKKINELEKKMKSR